MVTFGGMCARDNGVDILLNKQLFKHLEKQGEKKSADSYCQENCKGFQETGKCFADEECKAKRETEQKSVWNEDDETKRNALISLIKEIKNQPLKRLEDWDGYINWLQSLKDRVQPKQEWSEEDEIYYKRVQLSIEWARAHNRISEGSCDEQLNWLKSLRPQKRWKPSDEQMKALWLYAEQNNYDGAVLTSLYNDLKKK